MQHIESIKKYNFELKITALFIIIAAAWFHQSAQKRGEIISQKNALEIVKKEANTAQIVVLKKI